MSLKKQAFDADVDAKVEREPNNLAELVLKEDKAANR